MRFTAHVALLSILLSSASLAGNGDCNENGVDDALDIANLTSPDCNSNGIPDECEINQNSTAPGGPFFCTTACDLDCNDTGVPDACELAGNDCNADGRPDECGAFMTCNNTDEQKLTIANPRELDRFGGSVSVSGDSIVVGTWGSGAESAYVYRFDGTNWIEQQKLTATDSAPFDQFGQSVAVSGRTAIVGAVRDDCAFGEDCGAAYVYRFDGSVWIEEQKLIASDPRPGDSFGTSVALSAGRVVVGSDGNNCPAGSDCGAAYVFRFDGTNWIEEQKLTASDEAQGDNFGSSVSISGEKVVVGTSYGTEGAYVYHFDGTNWIEQQKLTASDGGSGDSFGKSVSNDGNTIVVGAPGYDCMSATNCGAAFVYRFDGATWSEEQRLTAPDAGPGDNFGVSVSVSLDHIVVGSYSSNCTAGADCGAAYAYRYDGATWIEQTKLESTDGAPGDYLGFSVSTSGDTVIAGAFTADCPTDVYCGGDCGAAYVFKHSASDSNCNGLADPCETDCNGNGIADQFEVLPDSDGDTVFDGCDVCPAGDDTIDGDDDGIPDCSEDILSPRSAPAPHDYGKTRYISIDPRGAGNFNAGINFDIRVTLTCTLVSDTTAVGSSWWAHEPDADCIAHIWPTRPPQPINWDACPILHLTGCPIVPTSTYHIAMLDEADTVSSPPLRTATVSKPGVKWFGDVVSSYDPVSSTWGPPQGTAGIDDAVAIIKTFQDPDAANATHVSVSDLHPFLPTVGPGFGVPNKIVNIDDVYTQILGFQGNEWPGAEIHLCPDL